MAPPKFHNPSGGIKKFAEASYYSQTVDLGNGIVKTSGQGGWSIEGGPLGDLPEDARAQVDGAFANINHILQAVGLGISDVFLVRSYHTDIDETMGFVSEAMRRLIPTHRPIWTAVGVTRLGHPSMKIEVEVEARRA